VYQSQQCGKDRWSDENAVVDRQGQNKLEELPKRLLGQSTSWNTQNPMLMS